MELGDYVRTLRSRFEIMGKKSDGFCVICGSYGKLTGDHVPPKGCVAVEDVVLRSLTPDQGGHRGYLVQGGVKFHTLCNECNNDRLGTLYDPHLKDLVDQIRTRMRDVASRIALPRFLNASMKSHHVARSVIGHILAAHSVSETSKRHEKLGANDSLREYFLDESKPFPEAWRLYCWPYFYRDQLIIRHFSIADTAAPNIMDGYIYGHVLKFLPVAFWLVYEKPKSMRIHAYEITPLTGEADMRIPFDFSTLHHKDFPEAPQGNFIALYSDHQVSRSSPKRKF